MKLRAPAVPLITVDPYFSVWSPDTNLNHTKTEHWSAKGNSIIGTVEIDGESFLFLGYNQNAKKIQQVSLDIDALSTTAIFENEKIILTAKFLTPLIPDDYRLLTRPVSYLEIGCEYKDGKEHNVKISIAASEELCLDEPNSIEVVTIKRTAEMIKIEVGSALTQLDNPPDEYAVHGRDLLTGIPKEIKVNYSEIAHCLDKSIAKIETAVLNALEQTPPELAADIYRTGIYLTGGGALLRGLDKRLHAKTQLPIHVADDPLRAVARGTGIALKNFDKFPFLIK